jgi:nucleotide-binding universal stress UspA family protein
VDYDRILVPVQGTRLSDEMMVLACQLAAEKDAVIDALYVLEVPMNLPLDASLPDGRARGKHVLDTAMAVAREFGVEAWPHLVSARSPGRAIEETAREWNADVIIMGAVRRQRADGRLVGDTVAHVMRRARAEVLLNLVPDDYPMPGSAAQYDAEQAAARQQGSPDAPRGR